MRARTFSAHLLIVSLLVLAMIALAQSRQSSSPDGNQPAQKAQQNSSDNPNAPTASGLTIRGCLMQGKQGYTLMQEATTALFQLQGDAAQLARSSGKTVEVRGRELEPPPQGTNAGQPQGVNLPRFQVIDLRVLADECPVTPKATNGTPATGAARNPEPDATPRYQPENPNQRPPAVPINPNTPGASGAPSAGTGNPPKPPGEQAISDK